MFLLLIFSQSIASQQLLIDSLLIQSRRSDIRTEERIKTLADLGEMLRYQDIREAIQIGEEAIGQSHQLNDRQYTSYAWSKIYYTYRKADSLTLVLKAIDSTMWYAEKSKNPIALGNAFRVAGNYAWYRNENAKAVENLLKALDLLKDTGQSEETANIFYILTGIYATKEDQVNNEKYARYFKQFADQSDNPSAKCQAAISMGSFFEEQFNQAKSPELMDSAIYHLRQAVHIFEQNQGIIKAQWTGGTAALNYAAYLWEYFPEIPKDSIFVILQKAISWASNINDQQVIAMSYGLMSEYLSQHGEYDQAEKILTKSLATLEKQPSPNYDAIRNIAGSLYALSEKMNDKDKTLKYYKLYIDYYKKLYDIQQMSEVKILEATFNYQKKEQEIEALKKQAAYNKKMNIFSLGTALLCILVLVFIFISYHLKLKSATQQKLLSDAKAKDAEMQKRLKEEETKRLLLEQELIRQQKEQLQKEVFAGAVQLKQKNEVLKTVRKEISTSSYPATKLDKIIKENLQVDDLFEEYKSLVKEIHPNFYKQLQAHAQGKLSELDLKYCTYIYLNIPAKQMAIMLHVEYSTIRIN